MTTAKRLGVTILSAPLVESSKSIVLVRGLGRSSAFWLDFPRYLSQKRNVIMLDLPGSGRSPSFWGRSKIEDLAADVYFTLEQEGLLGSHILGISLGGMVVAQAALLAERANTPFASVVIINSSARFTKQKRISPIALVCMLWQILKLRLRHRAFVKYLVSDAYLQKHPQLPELWDGLWRAEKISRLPVVRQLLAAAKFWGQNVYRNLKTPVLFLTSPGDKLVSWTNSIALWHSTSAAQLQIFDGPGHDIPTEQPKDVADCVLRFYEQCNAIEGRGVLSDSNMVLAG